MNKQTASTWWDSNSVSLVGANLYSISFHLSVNCMIYQF